MSTTKPFRILIDGQCPLCRREADFLQRMDRNRGRLVLEDITAAGFDPHRYGLTQEDVMRRIHGVLPGGKVISGVEVLRKAYEAVGLGWLVAPSRWPLLKRAADAAYEWFARNRMRLTGKREACPDNTCRPPVA
jgi:predicted DCC family thiol-disulfide oxidoreductase YuxK